MKRILFLCFCLFCNICVFAQSNMNDEVYLKDGSVIRGSVIGTEPEISVISSIEYGHVFTFDKDEVIKIVRGEDIILDTGLGPRYAGHKSVLLAYVFSYVVPGLGHLYLGDKKAGWKRLGWTASSVALIGLGGSLLEKFGSGAAFFMVIGGGIYACNWIYSIFDSVILATKINANNGYLTFNLPKGMSLGVAPTLTCSQPLFSFESAYSLNAGLGFRLTF